jgi:hypothetical protein
MRPRIQHKTWAEVLQTRAKKKRAGTKFSSLPALPVLHRRVVIEL